MEAIISILDNMKDTLESSLNMFLNTLRQGKLPTLQDFKNLTFKNSILIVFAKNLCV